ncbi:GGDEF domain-containing protein [Peteryoungia desertarenae]|uniref:diguanylate cyclase n=1 Tax=Peteryoungia desertarenae TaxID=1813451 RepID=A0ABX6QPX0_9HYPH|nr:GGDEF domain-containing protein [Peteryoungia desertarenae]QLF70580.1 GGDEF domain-containing protein [Peteryoungia desertarenae]
MTVSVAQGLMLLGMALAWQGLRLFDGRSIYIRLAAVGPALWVLLSFSVPALQLDGNLRFVVGLAFASGYSALMVWEHLTGGGNEYLPSRPLLLRWFTLSTVTMIAGTLAAVVQPLPPAALTGETAPLWYKVLLLVLFTNALAASVSLQVLSKERLQREAHWAAATDRLTGLANRGSFLSLLETLSTKVRGEGAFLYVDVDHVKRINDRFGHSGGDMVLKTCASLISRELPQNALVGRLAGAEFAAYVPDCDVARAEALGNTIRESVAEQMFILADEIVSVTVSIGVAHGAMQVSPDELLKRADAALHTAKVGGRNSVVVWNDGDAPSFA